MVSWSHPKVTQGQPVELAPFSIRAKRTLLLKEIEIGTAHDKEGTKFNAVDALDLTLLGGYLALKPNLPALTLDAMLDDITDDASIASLVAALKKLQGVAKTPVPSDPNSAPASA